MPLFKKGEKSDVSNYRLISLISCVGKSFERIVYKHIYNHITANSLLYKYQSEFLPGHSTVHYLIELIHHTCLALDKYETMCHVFCDISKAFDRVWQRGLIHQLKKIWNLRRFFRLDSKLSVHAESKSIRQWHSLCLSSLKFILVGVPQGSVLGPLSF